MIIKSAVEGPGHFLGGEQTIKLMKTDYVYPEQADRRSAADWQDAGSEDMWHRAGEFASGVLASHRPVAASHKDIGDSEVSCSVRQEGTGFLAGIWKSSLIVFLRSEKWV
ncbi:trimethylamine methyltransferase family protein [Granulosicoccus sp.]|nr:trimethylamine methyltransferase family protein [Granulosicoccus sp.]MDB4224507.1 trimethylamine methyltransferase family protein [Granulosicoccus sp.]